MVLTTHTEEIELIQQLKDNSRRAFNQLYNKYSKPILWRLRHMVKDPEEADELLQDLFVKVWERRHQIDINQPFQSYLYQITQHIAIDYFRKIARQSKLYEQVQMNTTEIIDNTQELLNARETQRILDQAISRLPEQRRLAFTLCKIEGKSHKEAAVIMNISPNTVHNHLVKAVDSVKDYLEKSGKILSPLVLVLCIATL